MQIAECNKQSSNERMHRRVVPRTSRFSPKSAQTLKYCHSYEGAYLLKRGLFLPDEVPAIQDALRAANRKCCGTFALR